MSDNISAKATKKDKAWMVQYEALSEFKRVHGHCHVQKNKPDRFHPNHKLALWVNRQRKAHEKGSLPDNRKEMLDDLDFYWNPNDYVWDQHYREIKALFQEIGHVDIPFNTKGLNDSNRMYQPFMEWAKEQRILRILRVDENCHTMMSDWRLEKLESIGFQWEPTGDDRIEILQSLMHSALLKEHKWRYRKIPDWKYNEVLDAIKKAKAEATSTGEIAAPMLRDKDGSVTLLARESDGTIVLANEYDVEAGRYENFVGFAPEGGEEAPSSLENMAVVTLTD